MSEQAIQDKRWEYRALCEYISTLERGCEEYRDKMREFVSARNELIKLNAI